MNHVLLGAGPDEHLLTLDSEHRYEWVNPVSRSVWMVRRDGSAARLTEADELRGEDVLPGSACPVRTLFADL
jgi:hypothetical protein